MLCALALHASRLAADDTFVLDPARTEVTLTLQALFHTVHGTFKLKRGDVRLNRETGEASGLVVIDATSGNTGNSDRDERMHKSILESGRFPEITFAPKKVIGTVAATGDSQVQVQGVFTLHGAPHEMTVPVDVHPQDGDLNVTAHFVGPYVKWGLKNPSTLILRGSDKAGIDVRSTLHPSR